MRLAIRLRPGGDEAGEVGRLRYLGFTEGDASFLGDKRGIDIVDLIFHVRFEDTHQDGRGDGGEVISSHLPLIFNDELLEGEGTCLSKERSEEHTSELQSRLHLV